MTTKKETKKEKEAGQNIDIKIEKNLPKLEDVASKTEADFDFKIDLDEMLKAGVYFGHRSSRTHPKMQPYIYSIRNTIHIIDLQKSAEKLQEALKYLKDNFSGKSDKFILFVGTTPPAKAIIKETAQNLSMPYVIERWLGGTITNFSSILKRLERFLELEQRKKSGEFEKYSKKDQHMLNVELQKFEQRMGGIKNMNKVPDLVFVVDLKKDYLAIKEARMKGIATMAFCDTSVDPTGIDFPIPANDDAISSIKYILGKIFEVLKS